MKKRMRKSGTEIYKTIIFILIGVVIVLSNVNLHSIANDKENAVDVISNTIIFKTKDGVSEGKLKEILKNGEGTLRKENRDISIVYDVDNEIIYINEIIGDKSYTQKVLHVKEKEKKLIVK